MSDELEKLKLILSRALPEEEVQTLVAELTTALGQGSVAIAGDATGAVTITGNQNVVGDNNHIVFNQTTNAEEFAQALYSLLKAINTNSMKQQCNTGVSIEHGDNIHISNYFFQDTKKDKLVVEEEKLSQKECVDSVILGLTTLAEVMSCHREARLAVSTFRAVFQIACKHIDIIANYKAIHDQLHKLELQCHIQIIGASKSFPENELALDILDNCKLTLQDILRDLQEISERDLIISNEVLWLKDLKSAHEKLQISIEVLDGKQLQETIRLLDRILARQLSFINTKLCTKAQDLNLSELVDSMSTIWNRLDGLNFNYEMAQQFQNGTSALLDLDKRLTILIDSHNSWQNLDSELRWIEKNLVELEASWHDLKKRTETLLFIPEEARVISFQEAGQNLGAAIDTQNPVKIEKCFRIYRQCATKYFDKIDGTLKYQCEELRELGKPLALILEMIG